MSLHFNNLPFERGSTYSDGAPNMTLANVSIEQLVGARFVVPDTQHSTGVDVVLRLVKNETGAAITAANQIFGFHYSSKDFGRKVDAVTSVHGEIGLPIDDAYASSYSIAANDYFYVVERGPCNVAMNSSSVALVAHDPVTTDTAGAVHGTRAAAQHFILGTIDQDCSTTTTAALIWVDANLWNPSGSGT